MNDSISPFAETPETPAELLLTLRRIARILHAGAPLPAGLRQRFPEIAAISGTRFALRKDALNGVAIALGFASWNALKQAVESTARGLFLEKADFSDVYLLNWCRDYASGRAIHQQTGGYLFGFRTQCAIAEAHFVKSLGLDPGSPDWARLGNDTLSGRDPLAVARLSIALAQGRAKKLAAREERTRHAARRERELA